MLTIAALSIISVAVAQKVGDDTPESHPSLTWQECTSSGCSNVNGEIVIDANWRWFHNGNYQNCYDGNDWTGVCTSNEECAQICHAEGADYSGTYGISASGDAVTLDFVTEHAYGTNIGSRIYLMEDTSTYKHFDLIGNELAFDVDLSTVACGLNSALYFVAMPADGGLSSQPENEAGAEYGTGYCDAQCARDLKFLGGIANYEGWEPSDSDDSAGVGGRGACCAEIDVWESNAHAFALTPHACENNDYHVCVDGEGAGCGGTYSEERYGGLCDANGCDYNPYRMGNVDFYGAGRTVDTSQPFTVVTQFTASSLTQFFIQGGQRIDIPAPTFEGFPDSSEINAEFCDANFQVFDEYDRYNEVGGWPAMEEALSVPHVLVLSIWADHYANMLWLDGSWPRDADPATPGVTRGDCPADSGVPSEVIEDHASAYVTWSNIRFGPIGSTTEFS
ncbi:cellobiohydrolase [Stachybotrys elegans]|uniref:Glucanase n=1 Tax=Stachybotrys elegans TaxID=80388 RepID=A0A8K0S8H0_9HYPO|nr:cellobiohydrolase [Stachybotrys elegans]